MKILYITTIGVTMGFFKSFIKEQLDIGNQIDIATNENDGKDIVPSCYREWGCKVFHIDTSRSPINFGNIRAIKQIRDIVSKNHYDIVHCHTPLAATATRIACRPLRKHGVKVIYTAHGFHFYTGAPVKNWIMYYPVEWLCSWFTDIIITINREDYKRAKNNFHAQKVEYVPGVGIDLAKFNTMPHITGKKREKMGFAKDDILLLSVGELSDRKNQNAVIQALAKMDNKNVHYLLCGTGSKKDYLFELAKKNGISNRVHMLGYRNDINEICQISDLFVFPSKQEGLPVALMEAIACRLPVICSNIRGNNDLVTLKKYLFDYNDIDKVKMCIENAINKLSTLREEQKTLYNNLTEYSLGNVIRIMSEIYNKCK